MHAGYFCRFVLYYLAITRPLTSLTKKGTTDLVQWMEPCQQAFTQVKLHFVAGHFYGLSFPFVLQTDASDSGLEAVLSYVVDGKEWPRLFISCKLSMQESMYSTIKTAFQAIKWAVRWEGLSSPVWTMLRSSGSTCIKDVITSTTYWYLPLQHLSLRRYTGRGPRWLLWIFSIVCSSISLFQ